MVIIEMGRILLRGVIMMYVDICGLHTLSPCVATTPAAATQPNYVKTIKQHMQ